MSDSEALTSDVIADAATTRGGAASDIGTGTAVSGAAAPPKSRTAMRALPE